MFRDSSRTVTCWAMGLTQHRNSVATIKEIANVAFLQGNIGKPGAGLCPVRGHSNVQGDRTMGIWERPKPAFLDALRDEFDFEPPREHGFDTVEAVKALADGRARVFFAMGGNFVSAVSDTDVTEQAMRNAELTVHVSTKLNRSHVVHGRTALILPALGRSEKDLTGGREQRVTVEDSMSAVHASKGPLDPASDAAALRGRHRLLARAGDARRRARHPVGRLPLRLPRRSGSGSPGWCPAARRTTRRSSSPAASRCRTRRATAASSRPRPGRRSSRPARSRCSRCRRGTCCCRRCARTTSSTPRSTASTTATAASRTAAGWSSCTPTTSPHLGWKDGDHVDLVSVWHDGSERCATEFRIVAYDQPRGCAAAYYPETNPLVPLDSKAEGSNTPTSKSVIIRLEKPAGRRTGVITAAARATRSATSGATDPIHQSAEPTRSNRRREQPRGQTRRARLRSHRGTAAGSR